MPDEYDGDVDDNSEDGDDDGEEVVGHEGQHGKYYEMQLN